MNLKKSSLAPGETISSTVAPPAQGWPRPAGGPVPPAPTCPAVPVSLGGGGPRMLGAVRKAAWCLGPQRPSIRGSQALVGFGDPHVTSRSDEPALWPLCSRGRGTCTPPPACLPACLLYIHLACGERVLALVLWGQEWDHPITGGLAGGQIPEDSGRTPR